MPGGDSVEDIGEPRLGIDIVHFTGFDQRGVDGPISSAIVRTGEQMILAPEGDLPFILPVLGPKSRFIIAGTRCIADECACITARCETAPAANITFSGFAGADTFKFSAAADKIGDDAIDSFNTARDKIDLSRSIYSDFVALEAAIKAGPLDAPGAMSTLIVLAAHDTLMLLNVAPGRLTAANFTSV